MIGGINSVWKQFVVLNQKYHLEKTTTTTHFKYRKNIINRTSLEHGLLMNIFLKYLIFYIYISYTIHYNFFLNLVTNLKFVLLLEEL